MGYKILLVDDDTELVKMLSKYFERKKYRVITAQNGKEAIEKLQTAPDIILLDINMPQMDGMEVCKKIRNYVTCPILFLTARIQEQDQINGLMIGGDDYIMKPFAVRELGARVAAHLRREQRTAAREDVRFQQDLVINYSSRQVLFQGKPINFTRTEFDLVEFLSLHKGQVFSRERIYELVWGYDSQGDSDIIMEHIRRIRMKLRKYTETSYIETVWGVGYKWIG